MPYFARKIVLSHLLIFIVALLPVSQSISAHSAVSGSICEQCSDSTHDGAADCDIDDNCLLSDCLKLCSASQTLMFFASSSGQSNLDKMKWKTLEKYPFQSLPPGSLYRPPIAGIVLI